MIHVGDRDPLLKALLQAIVGKTHLARASCWQLRPNWLSSEQVREQPVRPPWRTTSMTLSITFTRVIPPCTLLQQPIKKALPGSCLLQAPTSAPRTDAVPSRFTTQPMVCPARAPGTPRRKRPPLLASSAPVPIQTPSTGTVPRLCTAPCVRVAPRPCKRSLRVELTCAPPTTAAQHQCCSQPGTPAAAAPVQRRRRHSKNRLCDFSDNTPALEKRHSLNRLASRWPCRRRCSPTTISWQTQ